MKLVGAAFGSRFVSRFACIRCYFGFASTGNVREAPRVATRLDRGGVDLFRRQVRKLGINALKALASELELSVEGSRLKEEFASRVCAKIEVQESVTRLRCVVQSGGTKGLWTQLKALKVEDLRVIAQEIGLPSSGVRDAVMKRLFDDISAQESGTTGRPMSFQGMSYVLRWRQLCDRDYRRADEWSRGLERSFTLLMQGIVLRLSRHTWTARQESGT